ncbi:MAG: SDR family NAD(P)-dependent oxidoreductase [Atribacterota bacterium]|nr:SDR family NAD(P)-dependent oxidoreductase [Atribacterota bacterium]
MDIKGKVAVVTGATGGLGSRICLALAKEKVNICLVYAKSKEKAEHNLQEIKNYGVNAAAVQADITTEDGIEKMFSFADDIFGGFDILILDAAYNESIPFQDLDTLDADKWRFILNYNLTSPYLAARKAAPYMRKRGGGRIVTISSVAGFRPSGSSMAYSVSKAGLIHLTKCLAVALAPDILVNDIAPGLMEGTRMTDNLTREHVARSLNSAVLKKAADKDDVADAVLLFTKTDSITGQTLLVDAGSFFH